MDTSAHPPQKSRVFISYARKDDYLDSVSPDEEHTYHLDPAGQKVLGAHMLEICPSIAAGTPSLEVHPLGIGRPTLSIAPDGLSFVYVAEVDGESRLYKERFDSALAEGIPGTGGGYLPVFSPSGEWVALFTSGKLRKVLYAGSEPVTLSEVRNQLTGKCELVH